MMLWSILTFLTTATALAIAFPLIRRYSIPDSPEDRIIAVGRDQLAELDRDIERGQIDETEVAAARAEIERRIVAAAKSPTAGYRASTDKSRTILVFAIAGWLVAGATWMYTMFGQPELPSRPFAGGGASMAGGAMTGGGQAAPAPVVAATGGAAATGNAGAGAGAAMPAAGSVDELIANLEARLQQNPNDAEGLRMLAWSYFNTERYGLAAETYEKSVALDASDPRVLSAFVEARVRAADGMVDDKSVEIIRQTLELDPADPRARFFLGMAEEQNGNPEGALEIWQDILANAPEGAEWVPGLVQRVEELAAANNLQASIPEAARMATPAAPPMSNALTEADGSISLPPVSGTAPRGPTQADVAAASEMTPQERQAMIQGMVAQLANRLEENPDDPDGWMRLIRSYAVMGNATGASEALARTRELFADRPDVLGAIEATAAELGVE